MDRTSWIAVTLCTLGLIWWFYTQPKALPRQDVPVVHAAGDAATSQPVPAAPSNPTPEPVSPAPAPSQPEPEEQTFVINDEGIEVTFSTKGGGVKTSKIPAHEDFSGDVPTILNEFGRASVGALSTGIGQIEDAGYELKSGPGAFPIIFERTTGDNLFIRKEWTPVKHEADKGFLWQLRITFRNLAATKHTGTWHLYAGALHPLRRSDQVPCGAVWNGDGEAAWDGEDFVFDDKPQTQLEKRFSQLLWAGVRSQYYTTLIANTAPLRNLPAGGLWAQRHQIDFSSHQGGSGEVFSADAAVTLPAVALEPQQEAAHTFEVYMGPRARSVLSKLDQRPEAGRRYADVMFYGWWGFISSQMLWLLTVFQSWMGSLKASWGWAVILLTLVVRGLLWPLTIKSTRQMKRMSLLAPQMKELQAKYKDEPQRINVEVMKLYKSYGVNPLSGCLPVVIQIPIFFGLYRMLQSAVELRGQGIWWVDDLSMPDTEGNLPQWLPWFFKELPVNPLPLIMTGTMFIQMLMTPKSPDPNMQQQQRILMIMPFFFLFVCYDFASALALYWTISNIVGIIQSWAMKKLPEPALQAPVVVESGLATAGKRGSRPGVKTGKTRKGGGKRPFMELFAQRLAEQQKKAATKPRKPRSGGGPGTT
ncbi:MAG: YidC/Oxa1 family insertase periplasmic-domain containing protein [Verrucomicrobiales bacterium]